VFLQLRSATPKKKVLSFLENKSVARKSEIANKTFLWCSALNEQAAELVLASHFA